MREPLRVLMVEDSEDSCLLITAELEKHGYEPLCHRIVNAEQLRRALAEQDWDIIIADYVVPGFDALASLKLTRELGSDLPFFIVSGNLGEEVAVAVMKAGAQDYITKGNLTRLVPAIQRELREAESRRIEIAERQQAEEALRQSEARFRGVLENLGEGLLLTDSEDLVWYVNSRMAQLTGYGASEMVGRSASDFLRQPQAAKGLESKERNFERARGAPIELELICKDGKTIWTWVHAAPLFDSQGEITGISRAITDITERRQAREALRKSQASLLLAQRIGHVGSWELNFANETMEWSSETYRILDVGTDGSHPSLERFCALVHDEDQKRVRQAFERAIEEGSSCRVDCRIVRLDASERFIHIQAQVILDSAEQPVQMIGTIQDITERKLLEEQLRHSQKMDAIGQLAGGIAHDFNNLLTVIQGYTELITCQPGLDESTRAFANQIAISADRASKLTRQLLAFSRKQVMQFRNLSLNELLNDSAAMLQRVLGEHCQLSLNLEHDLPPVHADSGMIEQVLVNLVVNGRDAMPKGGRLIIETSLHQIDSDVCRLHPEATPGTFVCLGVIDTGCGIKPETLSRIFEPFFTTKEVGRGTGLGLATVYGIVKQHQGWVQVASELGRGSAFKVFLPVTVNVPMATTAAGSAHKTLLTQRAETILLVEDEPPLRQLARSVLERFGYKVIEAASGPDALALWKQGNRIDLLLTDMVMPGGMTGRDLALKLLGEDPKLKVLYTSGYSLDFVESDLLYREGINFIPKPYNGTSLGQAVRACLDRE